MKTIYLIAAVCCSTGAWWLWRKEGISLNQTLGQIHQEIRRRGIKRRHPLGSVLALAGVVFLILHWMS